MTNQDQADLGAGIAGDPTRGRLGLDGSQGVSQVRLARLSDDPLGTAHHRVRCQWCQSLLVIGEYEGLRCWVCPQDWARQIAHALVVQVGKTRRAVHVPLPCQVPFYEAGQKYLLWGGQAGPGKSTGARRYLYSRSLTVPGHEALLLRENWDQLKANHTIKMAHEVPELGGRWYETDRLAVFGKGSDQSLIYCGHMAEAGALERYIGIEYGAIVCDEASLYPVTVDGTTPLAELSTRARKVYEEVWGPSGKKVAGTVLPRFLPVTNPGGPSAPFLKDFFIDRTPDLERYPALKEDYDPEEWGYLPASLDENPYLPPDYERSLAVLNKTRYEQLRHGDWNVFFGQFFAEFAASSHVAEAVFVN